MSLRKKFILLFIIMILVFGTYHWLGFEPALLWILVLIFNKLIHILDSINEIKNKK